VTESPLRVRRRTFLGRAAVVAATALLTLALLALSGVIAGDRTVPLKVVQSPSVKATVDARPVSGVVQGSLYVEGIDPDAISLAWTPSTASCFGDYVLNYHDADLGSGSAWEGAFALNQESLSSYFATDLSVPEHAPTTVEWQLLASDCSGATTNAYYANLTQPAEGNLSCAATSDTAAACSWTTGAQYGGLLAFYSYKLVQQGGPTGAASEPFTVVTLTSQAQTSYVVTGLTPGASYSFVLTTTDECSGSASCPETSLSAAQSSWSEVSNTLTTPSNGTSSTAGGNSPVVTSFELTLLGLAVAIAAALVVAVLVVRRHRDPPYRPPGGSRSDGGNAPGLPPPGAS
jgi:hypothetical protein